MKYTPPIEAQICAGDQFTFGGNDYAISGIYRDTLVSAGGCDSIVTLTLTVVDEVLETIAAEICQGDQYLFAGINYSTSGVYRDTLMSTGGCDSIVELTLTVLTGSEQNITAEICEGESFVFGNSTLTASGTYRDTITASNGCDSIIILELTVHRTAQTLVEHQICEGSSFVFGGQSYNTSGTYHDTLATQQGCDSVITLMLSVLDQFETDIAVQICVDDEYVFGGNTLTQSGIYRDTLSSVDGCDSIIILDLAVVDEIHTPVEAQICAGDQFTFGGNDYAISGIYRDTLVSAGGCDSIVTLTLTVVDEVLETIAAEICQGDQYLFAGINYSTAGVYRDTLRSAGGCDSIVELTLTVLTGSEQNITAEICQGDQYLFGGINYTTSGTYRDTIPARNGCDSIIILELTVHPTAQTLVEQEICEGSSFVFGGQSYNTSGTYHDTLATQHGCDSVITLMLSVLDQFETDIAAQICVGDEYVFGGNTFTQSGIYRDTLSSVDGCDSIIILDLAVVDEIYTPIEAQICAGDQFTFGGEDYAIAGIYRDTLVSAGGCDSIVTLTLTVVDEVLQTIAAEICQGDQYLFAGINYSTAGVYRDTLRSAGGCDSIVELTLTVFNGSDQNITAEICQGDQYLFGGINYTTSGTYRDTIPARNGCDSIIILELTVHPTAQTLVEQEICEGSSFVFGGQSYNTSGTYHDTLATQQGCDSVITLMLSVLDQFETDIAVQICVGDEYVFGGNTFTQSGIYRDTLSSVDGCDSIIILDLAVVDEIYTPIEAQICAGDQFTFGGEDYAIAGIYRDTLVSAGGCDSIVTLTLTVVDEVLQTIAAEICQGDQYLFGGINYSTAGVYRDTLRSAGGCDSIVELTLTVFDGSEQNITAEICEGESFVFGNSTLTASGTYRDTITASNGCDSIIILELTVHRTAQTLVEHQICEGSSFVFGGQSYNTSGTYHDTLATQQGCDSVITLMLSVLDQFETDIAVQICVDDEYVFGGNTLTQSGIYRDTLSSVDGCDSIIILDLAVVDEIHTPIEAQICAGDQFTFGGNDYAISGIYRDTLVSAGGCDSIVTLTLTVVDEVLETIAAEICQGDQYLFAGINYSTSGVYRDTLMSTGGCDSIVELTLTVLDGSEQNITAEICEGESFVFGNSTLTASGTYRDTITASNGCDSIIILELTVHRTAQTLVEHQICEGSSFVFGGQSYNTSGTYHDTLATQQGCDSVITLMLSVLDQFETDIAVQICVDDEYVFGGNTLTQSGIYRDTLSSVDGCDSIIILDLAVVDEIHTPIEAQICAGDQFTFGGNDYAISGIYRDTLVSAGGCDSIVTLTLTVVDEVLETIAAEICQGDQYLFGGINYSTSGVYRDTLMSTGGCDSIVELTLTVHTVSEQNITAEICQGDQYLFGGINYSSSGTYRDTIPASNGCDSIIILELTVHPTAQTLIEHLICEGSSFVFGGQSYNTSGTYHDTLATQQGCDSVITLMLSVLDQFETEIAVQICVGDEYVFGGNTLTQSGIYRDTLSSVDGCDSIIILDLAVVDEIHTTIEATICSGDQFTFGGNDYATSGIYRDTLISAGGCDSIITLALTVVDEVLETIAAEICQGDQYLFAGINYSNSGVYRDTLMSTGGCDSIVELTLTVLTGSEQNITAEICQGDQYLFGDINYSSSGTYRDTIPARNGCDSIIILELTVHPTAQTLVEQEICEGSSFVFGGQSYNTAGTYHDTLATQHGCDSVITLMLSVLDQFETDIAVQICVDDEYVFGGNTLTQSGIYRDTLSSVDGCDSIIILDLAVVDEIHTPVEAQICAGDQFTFGGNDYAISGIYRDTLVSAGGCDSIVTLTLTVVDEVLETIAAEICQGDQYLFAGINYSNSGVYRDTLMSTGGCDSIVELTLTVLTGSEQNITAEICQGDQYLFGDINYSSSGTYRDTIPARNGCDSIIILELTVHPTAQTLVEQEICEGSSFVFGGQSYNTAGTYHDTLATQHGCDSVITLMLSVLDQFETDIAVQICVGDEYVFGGNTFTQSGIYRDTLSSVTPSLF